MIGFAAERLMELEVQGLTGAGHGERSGDRINQRNRLATPPSPGSDRSSSLRWGVISVRMALVSTAKWGTAGKTRMVSAYLSTSWADHAGLTSTWSVAA